MTAFCLTCRCTFHAFHGCTPDAADEIGIPYAVTVDFESVQDRAVTLRERDTTAQVRIRVTHAASSFAKGLHPTYALESMTSRCTIRTPCTWVLHGSANAPLPQRYHRTLDPTTTDSRRSQREA